MKKRRNISSSARRPTPERLAQRLAQSGIALKPPQLEKLWRYHNLLRNRNQDRELTRLIGFETIVTKHYVDSLIVGNFIKLPSPLLDLGTGAGFPGIPLKIRYPRLELVLGEPRPKRVAFLEEAIRTLGLKDTSVFPHKVVSRSFQTPVAGVITRAVETMDKTVLRTSGCMARGGLLIYMKGPNCDDEIEEVERRFGKLYRLRMDQPYRLPGTPHQRRLVVWERTGEPFPRA